MIELKTLNQVIDSRITFDWNGIWKFWILFWNPLIEIHIYIKWNNKTLIPFMCWILYGLCGKKNEFLAKKNIIKYEFLARKYIINMILKWIFIIIIYFMLFCILLKCSLHLSECDRIVRNHSDSLKVTEKCDRIVRNHSESLWKWQNCEKSLWIFVSSTRSTQFYSRFTHTTHTHTHTHTHTTKFSFFKNTHWVCRDYPLCINKTDTTYTYPWGCTK